MSGVSTFDCSYRCSFDTRTSVLSLVRLRYETFDRAEAESASSSMIEEIVVSRIAIEHLAKCSASINSAK